MKKNFLFLLVLFVSVLIPFQLLAQNEEVFRQEGIASWYGREFEGRPTASGEIFDASALTAAHPALPFGTMIVVTNQHNNKSVTVRVNDRGPFIPARILDVSRAAAEQLDMIVTGTAPVTVTSVQPVVMSAPAIAASSPSIISAAAPVITNQPVVVSQPVVIQPVSQVRLIPEINILPDRNYRLQVGSYRNARNALETFERLKNSGLNPAYERYTNGDNIEYYRVVVAGVSGIDVQSTVERISAAGFMEALIRQEN